MNWLERVYGVLMLVSLLAGIGSIRNASRLHTGAKRSRENGYVRHTPGPRAGA